MVTAAISELGMVWICQYFCSAALRLEDFTAKSEACDGRATASAHSVASSRNVTALNKTAQRKTRGDACTQLLTGKNFIHCY